MSNIFEALNKGNGAGEVAKSILPMVDVLDRPAPPVGEEKGKAESIAARLPASAYTRTEIPGSIETPAAQIRCLPLRIAAPSPLLPFEDSNQQASEQYRILRTKIGQHPRQPRVIVVSSPAAGDGKSVTAVNIAGALALKTEAKVLLLDADMRRSTLHFQLGLPRTPGLADILTGACTLEEALIQTQAFPNLYVISAGAHPTNPVELLDNPRWPSLCTRLRDMFRYTIVDSPPVAALADFDLIQAACDGTILVLRPDHTNRQLYKIALGAVSKAKFLGVLLNCIPDWFLGKYQYSNYYYYSDRESDSK